MKRIFSTIIISLIGLTTVNGQTLDKNYIDNWILITFHESELNDNVLYVLNGVPFLPDSVNHELSKYKRSELIQINIIEKSMTDSLTLCRPYSDIILLTTKGMQTKKSIRQVFNNAKNKYAKVNLRTTGDIIIKKGEPALIINGKLIFFKNCYSEINSVKLSNIIGINYINRPVSSICYGTNGVNGLVEIKTK